MDRRKYEIHALLFPLDWCCDRWSHTSGSLSGKPTYQPGFLHAKSFVCDDEVGVVGTINLDYRSLYLHFEDGVWIYKNRVIADIRQDFMETLDYCTPIDLEFCRHRNIAIRGIQSVMRVLAPML